MKGVVINIVTVILQSTLRLLIGERFSEKVKNRVIQ